MAKNYLRLNKKNRPLNRGTVEFYARQMSTGAWRLNGQGISFLANGELGDGQHRLEAIILAGVPVTMTVMRGADNDSFPTYDTGRTRTASDIFSINNIPNAVWVSSTVQRYMMMRRGASAMTAGGNRKDVNGITNAQKIEEYSRHPDVFQAASLLGRRATNNYKAINATVVAGMSAYLAIEKGYSWDKIEDFFEALDNDEPSECASIRLLRTRIRRAKIGTVDKLKPQYLQNLIIRTWNDYITGNNDRKTLKWTKETEGELSFH